MAVRRGDEAFRYQDYQAAVEAYQSYLDLGEPDEFTARVYYKTALAEYRLGHYRQTLSTLDDLARRYPKAKWVQVDALRGDAERALGHTMVALQTWDAAWRMSNDADRQKLRRRILAVARSLNDVELARARRLVNTEDVAHLLDRQIAAREAPVIDESIPPTDEAQLAEEEEEEESYGAAEVGGAEPNAPEKRPPATPPQVAAVVPKPPKASGAETRSQVKRPAAKAPEKAAARAKPEAPPESQPQVPAANEPAEPEPEAEGGWPGIPDRGPAEEKEAPRAAVVAETAPPETVPAEPPEPAAEEEPPEEIIQGIAKVGCLLPLTGPAREFGEHSLRGLRLLFGQDSDRLVLKDTGSDPATATGVLQELERDPNVLVVIGPLRSEDADVVAPQAEQMRLPLFLLSQRDGLGGRYVMQVGMTRSNLVSTLLGYAMDRIRLRRFGIVYPSDAYGKQFLSAFREEVKRRGGTVVGTDAYRPQTRGVDGAAVKKWRKEQNLEAVFLPDSAPTAAGFAKYLQREMPDVTLLGVHGWETLADHNGTGLSGILFTDGFYADSTRPATREFVDRFTSAYGEPPGALEAQAYDAALLAKRALDAGANSRPDVVRRLQALGPVEGATGELNVTPDGVQRSLFLLQVYDGKLQEVGDAG